MAGGIWPGHQHGGVWGGYYICIYIYTDTYLCLCRIDWDVISKHADTITTHGDICHILSPIAGFHQQSGQIYCKTSMISPQMKVGNGQPAKMYQHLSWDQFLLEQICWPRLMVTGDVRKNAINYWHLGLGHPEPPRMQSTYCAPIIAWGSKHSYSGKVVLLLLGMGHNWGAEGINKIGKWLYFKLGNFL